MSIEAKPDTTEPMLRPDVVLQMARELHRFYSKKNDKPYTCDVLADCIATIENLQSRLMLAEEFRAMVSRLHCAWPNCDQPSGYDYCYEHCLNNLAHPSHNRAQVE